ncbi:hypothetical protein NPIL_121801, partial [Nephila pilipes]
MFCLKIENYSSGAWKRREAVASMEQNLKLTKRLDKGEAIQK